MYCVYIIYSAQTDRFYIGQTEDFPNRLKEHNSHTFPKSSTKIASDWVKYHLINCKSRVQAVRIENHIKRAKSRVYLKNISSYPEIEIKLLEKFSQ